MEPLDERRLRKPGFTAGTGVMLGDGQTWAFPKPWLRLYPVRTFEGSGSDAFAIGGGLGFDAETDDLADQLAADTADDPLHTLDLQFRMAARLLCRNYELTDAHLRRLLAVDLDDESCQERWARINDVLLGRVPKPSADGSAGPCS